MTRDIDHGYAWVVLAACAGLQIITDGITKSFGLFYVEMLEKYKGKVFITTLISGIMNAVYCISALPVMMCLIKKAVPRNVVIAGCIITSCGYSLSCLANNMHFLFFTISFIVGGGMALIYPTSVFILGTYFSRRRALANGIAISGSCLGGLAFPVLYRFLLDEYGIQGALLMTGGILLHNLPLGCLLRPNKTLAEDLSWTRSSEMPDKTKKGCIQKTFNDNEGDTQGDMDCECEFRAKHKCNMTELDPFLTSPVKGADIESSQSNFTDGAKFQNCNNLDEYCKTPVTIIQVDKTTYRPKSADGSEISSPGPCKPLQNPTFVLFVFANSLASIVAGTFLSFLPLYAKQNGMSNREIVILVSVAAAFDFIGRILSGVLADRPQIKTSHILAVSQAACGIIHICNELLTSFTGFLIFAIIVGLFSGIQLPLMFTHATEILGITLSSSGFSILIVGQLPAFILGPFFFGYLRDVTEDYATSYYFVGSAAFLAVLLFLLEPITNKYIK